MTDSRIIAYLNRYVTIFLYDGDDFQNADVHPEAELLPNGTKYNNKILEDKKTKEKRFYAYFTKEDIDSLRRDLFSVEEYHTEGGSEKKNWHVFTLKKTESRD